MPKFVYESTKVLYEVPEGRYLTEYLGSKDRDPYDGPSKFSKPPEPRLEWQFKVLEGPCAGKIISYTTGASPASTMSGCYKVVKGLLGRKPGEKESINTDAFLGHRYEVDWEVNERSEKGNMHIAALRPVGNGPGAIAAAAPPPTPVPTKSPFAKKTPPPPPPEERFLLDTGKEDEAEKLWTRHEAQTWISASGKRLEDIHMAREGSEDVKTAKDFGFEDTIPF